MTPSFLPKSARWNFSAAKIILNCDNCWNCSYTVKNTFNDCSLYIKALGVEKSATSTTHQLSKNRWLGKKLWKRWTKRWHYHWLAYSFQIFLASRSPFDLPLSSRSRTKLPTNFRSLKEQHHEGSHNQKVKLQVSKNRNLYSFMFFSCFSF